MAQVAKFMFDTPFDQAQPPIEEQRAEEEAILRAAFDQELEAARAQAFEEGRKAGAEEMRAALEGQIAANMERLIAQSQELMTQYQQDIKTHEYNATKLALETAKKLSNELINQHPAHMIENLFQSTLAQLRDAPHVTVYVPEGLQDVLKERFTALAAAQGITCPLTLIGDATIPAGSGRIEWGQGGIAYDYKKVLGALENIIAQNITQPDMAEAPPQAAQ